MVWAVGFCHRINSWTCHWRIMCSSPQFTWIVPQNFSVASFYLYAAPATIPSSPWFLGTVVPRVSAVKAFPSPAFTGICLRSSLPLRPWPCGASFFARQVWTRSFVCLYPPVWWWGASLLTLLWACQLLSWGHSKPLRVISSAFFQCHCENCHLHLKCYEWRPFTFLPLTMYLKYWRVHKLFN